MARFAAFSYVVNLAYNFGNGNSSITGSAHLSRAGTGGLTTHIPNAPFDVDQRRHDSGKQGHVPHVNYGAGVKFLNVAGPMGFRFDVRGRTLPNFFGETTTGSNRQRVSPLVWGTFKGK
jgi:hypothetical protein